MAEVYRQTLGKDNNLEAYYGILQETVTQGRNKNIYEKTYEGHTDVGQSYVFYSTP